MERPFYTGPHALSITVAGRTSTLNYICPDLLRLETIGAADNLRGRVVRAFFWTLDRVMPVQSAFNARLADIRAHRGSKAARAGGPVADDARGINAQLGTVGVDAHRDDANMMGHND